MNKTVKKVLKKVLRKIKKIVEIFLNVKITVKIKPDCSRERKKADTKIKYFIDKTFKMKVDYTNYYEKLQVQDKTILYESYHGRSMSCNPLAIFKSLLKDEGFKEYTHIWVLEDLNNCPSEYKNLKNVRFVEINSDKYLRYLASCKYLINNTTFPSYFIRKDTQVYVNTWHGTPFKTLGKHKKEDSVHKNIQNIQRNLLQTTHLIMPNKYTGDIMIDCHDVRGIFNGYVANIGYPRVDSTLNYDKKQIKMNLGCSEEDKVLLYAPTWRGEDNSISKEVDKFINDVEMLEQTLGKEYKILFRIHYFMQESLKDRNLDINLVPDHIDTNELLSAVDLLITDYSSIMFDFMPTRRPIIFYAYDKEQYESERGCYTSLDEMPGYICRNIEEVIDTVKGVEKLTIDREKLENAMQKYCPKDDGEATKRAIDLIFYNNLSNAYKVVDDKKNILIYPGGLLDNGITSSLINLLNNIDYNKYNVSVVISDKFNEESSRNAYKLNSNVKKIFRCGITNVLINEDVAQANVFRNGIRGSLMNQKELIAIYKRENKRVFGSSRFDIAIDFSGYSKFWTMLFAFGDFNRKVVYQHNDMLAEYNKVIGEQFKHRANLAIIFKLYNEFDKVVSVAKYTRDVNEKGLRNIVINSEDKMVYVHNSIDYEQVINLSQEKHLEKINGVEYYLKERTINNNYIDAKGFIPPKSSDFNFVNMGRLSPEKDQAKLIRAFARCNSKFPNTKLYILGDGILKKEIQEIIATLGLQDKIILTGQLNNPFGIINDCDCFVLSSNHEGQPMVLLESLILGKNIIATDIPGSRGLLEGQYGLLVENSEDGLVAGMEKLIVDDVEFEKFDYKKYNNNAMKTFYKIVCGEN